MATARGYVILTEDIHDEATIVDYGRASAASLAEHDGKVLVVDADVDVLEGTWHGTRTVVVEFESVDRAHQWYGSSSYQSARPLRHAAADCNVVIVAGFTMAGADG